jgi:hypothetical protein
MATICQRGAVRVLVNLKIIGPGDLAIRGTTEVDPAPDP